MAEQLSAEDFTEFVYSLRGTIERGASVYHAFDHFGLEICAKKLEEHTRMIITISLSQNSSSDLFEMLELSLVVLLRKTSDTLQWRLLSHERLTLLSACFWWLSNESSWNRQNNSHFCGAVHWTTTLSEQYCFNFSSCQRALSIQQKSPAQTFGIFAGRMESVRPHSRICSNVLCNAGHAGWTLLCFKMAAF